MALFFGAHYGATDYLYGCGDTEFGGEIQMFQDEGILTDLRTAFSRDQEHKIYVQHKLADESEMLYDFLVKRNGYFYLCGPSGPVPECRNAIVEAVAKHGNMSMDDADKYVTDMQITGRYNIEVCHTVPCGCS